MCEKHASERLERVSRYKEANYVGGDACLSQCTTRSQRLGLADFDGFPRCYHDDDMRVLNASIRFQALTLHFAQLLRLLGG